MTLKELKIYRQGYKKGLEEGKKSASNIEKGDWDIPIPGNWTIPDNWNTSTYYCAYKGKYCPYCSSLGTCENTTCPYDFNYIYTNHS